MKQGEMEMPHKTFARRFAWACLVGFATTGIMAAWTADVRFGYTAFVLIITALVSAMAAMW
jgi:hypothetical protein